MAKVTLRRNKRGWDKVVSEIINTDGVDRMERVADACNAEFHAHGHPGEGYKVGTEGDHPLAKHNFRATVITASAAAMAHDQHHESLIKNFHLAGGE